MGGAGVGIPVKQQVTPPSALSKLPEAGGRYQNFRVFYDRVLVLRLQPTETYKDTSIVQPDAFKKKPQEGIVLAVDPRGRFYAGLGFVPLQVKVGDHILFGVHSGVDIELLDGRTAFVLREDEIACVVDEPVRAIGGEKATA